MRPNDDRAAMQPKVGRMHIRAGQAKALFTASLLALLAVLIPLGAVGSVIYTYDPLGRVTTGLYDNGLCIAYAYDANGNRTTQTNTIASAPESATWGSGVWGCFSWTP